LVAQRDISLGTIDDYASKYINQYDDIRMSTMRTLRTLINERNSSVIASRLGRDKKDDAHDIDHHQITRSVIQLLLRIQCSSPADKNFTRVQAGKDDSDDEGDSKSDKVTFLFTESLFHRTIFIMPISSCV
jgi:hypothetical protein